MNPRFFGIFLVVCTALISGCLKERPGYVSMAPAQFVHPLAVLNDDQANSKNNYVSVAPLAGQKYVISNYVSLLLLDRKSGAVCKLAVDGNIAFQGVPRAEEAEVSAPVTYNPTGVYSDSTGRVYVANYKANNIVVGTVDSAACTFKPQGEYRSEHTRGPENVVVDEGLGLLVSANYDSGTVTAFDLISKKERWSASISQAHGVTISKGKVFATGLSERKIYELESSTGKIVRAKGELGWNPMAEQYMWPTSIYPLGNGDLVVADPQTGFISELNSETLKVKRFTGGNGPSEALFNYPYAAVSTGAEVVVLSSMRGEIIFLDPQTMKATEKYAFAQRHWPNSVASSIFGGGWVAYEDMSEFAVRVAGSQYKIGFGNLHSVAGEKVLKIPNSGSVFNPGSYIYFLQGDVAGDVDLLFSSSSTTLIGVVHRDNYPDVLVPRRIAMDSWAVNGDLVAGSGNPAELNTVSEEIKARADNYYALLDKQGWGDRKSLFSLLGFSSMGLNYEQFLIRLDAAFTSAPGMAFKRVYDTCTDSACDKKALKKAAITYFRSIDSSIYVSLDEYLLVDMLSGSTPLAAPQADIEFNACEGGKYYSDYGLSALSTETLDDYLAAVDLAGSALCFSVHAPEAVQGIDVIWNDQATAPRALDIYGTTSSGDDDWHLLKTYSDIAVAQSAGYAVSTFRFDGSHAYSRFLLKVVDGGVQNRLVIRRIRPVLAGDS
jgi:hypothetical protein